MDDSLSGISEILNDPQSMEKIKAMASSLFSSQKEEPCEQNDNGGSALGGIADTLDGLDMGALIKAFSALKNQKTDNRSQLLLALKPHLSANRQGRVDKAVKILKLMSLVPLLREQGILNF